MSGDEPDNQRFRRRVERLHALGARPLGELFLELIARWGGPFRHDLDDRLDRYTRLPPDTVRQLGGDCWPATACSAVAST